jgi:hypothetical protein
LKLRITVRIAQSLSQHIVIYDILTLANATLLLNVSIEGNAIVLHKAWSERRTVSRAERRHKPKQDNNYIYQERRWKAHIREMVPKIYAGFALTLHRQYGFDFDQIVNILAETQELWQSDGNNGFDILKTCSEETGINFMSKVTANALGVEGDVEV